MQFVQFIIESAFFLRYSTLTISSSILDSSPCVKFSFYSEDAPPKKYPTVLLYNDDINIDAYEVPAFS